jgi:septal ring factor EnvC (AmiA/AmiB activator)
MPLRRPITRCSLLAAAVLCTGLLGGAPEGSPADVGGAIASKQAAAQSLQAQVAADSRQISQTAGGLAAARARLSALQAAVAARESQLAAVQSSLVAARDHLTELENRLQASSRALAANLLATYEGNTPDALGVLLGAHGFADLLERVDFLKTVGEDDARVVHATRQARQAVVRQAVALGALEVRDRALAAVVLAQRNRAAALQTALLNVQIAQLGHRAHDAAALSAVQGQLHALRAQQAAAAAAQPSVGQSAPAPGAIQQDTGGMVQPPAGAPAAVAQVIAAGNAIAGLPYSYGGGHASFRANAYDCSGSVSYALAAAGLVSSPLDSTGFESWGQPGPGKWITVYANAGHAFMYVAGWRFDTVALSSGGTRWSRSQADTSGFVARHPAGL